MPFGSPGSASRNSWFRFGAVQRRAIPSTHASSQDLTEGVDHEREESETHHVSACEVKPENPVTSPRITVASNGIRDVRGSRVVVRGMYVYFDLVVGRDFRGAVELPEWWEGAGGPNLKTAKRTSSLKNSPKLRVFSFL